MQTGTLIILFYKKYLFKSCKFNVSVTFVSKLKYFWRILHKSLIIILISGSLILPKQQFTVFLEIRSFLWGLMRQWTEYYNAGIVYNALKFTNLILWRPCLGQNLNRHVDRLFCPLLLVVPTLSRREGDLLCLWQLCQQQSHLELLEHKSFPLQI